jgi:hypothetical protein
MYKQKLPDGTWCNLNGNVVFSPNVYQTAESLTNEQRVEFNVHWIEATEQPQVNHTFNVTEDAPELTDFGWKQVWVVSDATDEEVQQRTEQQASSVRAERNALLSSCDWTQLSDSPLNSLQKADWFEYRNELRNIPEQQGFPWEVVWPTQP